MPNKTCVLVAVALVIACHARDASAQFNVGASVGVVKGVSQNAMEDFEDTEFLRGTALSGSVGYRFGSGLTLEFNVQRLRMPLSELGEDFGTLQVTPLLGLIKYQGRPMGGRGLSGHGELGAGIALDTSFEKGTALEALEVVFAPAMFETEFARRPFVFEAGGGIDYFFTSRVALVTDFRFLITFIDSQWAATAPGVVVPFFDGSVNAFNGQVLVGVRVFVH